MIALAIVLTGIGSYVMRAFFIFALVLKFKKKTYRLDCQ